MWSKTATMHLKYHFSPGLIPALSHLKVSLNGSLFATLAVTNAAYGERGEGTGNRAEASDDQQAVIIAHDQNSAMIEATIW